MSKKIIAIADEFAQYEAAYAEYCEIKGIPVPTEKYTFDPLKITEKNIKSINLALLAVNRIETADTYNDFDEIEHLADIASEAMDDLDFKSQVDWIGARYIARSGRGSANIFAVTDATEVVLERRPQGWYLISAERITIRGTKKEAELILTAEQKELVAKPSITTTIAKIAAPLGSWQFALSQLAAI